ncbi:fungal-specific transcription factor domain-containing protein [Crucibulum laeve]|uniref:Fungal-specific transcription factor domain-containing protein n=1 Tax=Crucibulum laeve TaxID=68775 RepID=A0A5C3MH71_9AGAR|nr:fungal-specific transcription factor domain-containing protein [Crucibulum laeve]
MQGTILPYRYPQSSSNHHNIIDVAPSSSSSFPIASASLPSSDHSYIESSGPAFKKRKKDRACDACRRRKTKCDGPWMADNICTNCLQTCKPCTYVEMSKPRGPPKAYVTSLEDKVEKLESLLQQLQPNIDFSEELGPAIVRDSWKNEDTNIPDPSTSRKISHSASVARLDSLIPLSPVLDPPYHSERNGKNPVNQTAHPNAICPSTHLFQPQPRHASRAKLGIYRDKNGSEGSSSLDESSSSSDAEELLVESSIGGRKKLILVASERGSHDEDNSIRFHGRSSTAGLVETTRKFKHLHIRETMEAGMKHSPDEDVSIDPPNNAINSTRRPKFWHIPHWELMYEGHHADSPSILPSILDHFPPPELAASLIDLYFRHTNTYFPLLHRPTFERQYKERLHHKNMWFTAVCMSIFAVSSRWSEDRRVLSEDAKLENGEWDWSKAGWKYFEQGIGVHRVRRSLFYPATLFEIQTFTLLAMFLRGAEEHPTAWVLISVGIRKAQDIGAHRKKVYRGGVNADNELWKRAFWHLVVFDRIGSAILGRAAGIAEEDFDMELPLEVDDEYWETEDPQLAFRQPSGLPSLICSFNLFIKLTQIIAFTMKTVYAIDRVKVFGELRTANWREEVLKQINTAMADWMKDLPEHLIWSEKFNSPVFANQAATLHTTYHLNEMLIYRSFISVPPMPGVKRSREYSALPSSVSYPALSICIKAAQSCVRIVKSQLKLGISNIPNTLNVAHLSAGILLLKVWDLKAQQRHQRIQSISGIQPSLEQQIEDLLVDVEVFIQVLEWAEPRWTLVKPYLAKLRESLPGPEDDANLPSIVPEMRQELLPQTIVEIPEATPIDMHSSYPRERKASSQRSRVTKGAGPVHRNAETQLHAHPSMAHPPSYPSSSTHANFKEPHSNPDSLLMHFDAQLHSFADDGEKIYLKHGSISSTMQDRHLSRAPPLRSLQVAEHDATDRTSYQRHYDERRLAPSDTLPRHADRRHPNTSSGHARMRTFSDASLPSISYVSDDYVAPYISSMRRTSFSSFSNSRNVGGSDEDVRMRAGHTLQAESYTRSSMSEPRGDDVNMHSYDEHTQSAPLAQQQRHQEHYYRHNDLAPLQLREPSHRESSEPYIAYDRRSYRSTWDGQPYREVSNGREKPPDEAEWRTDVASNNTAGYMGYTARNHRPTYTSEQVEYRS